MGITTGDEAGVVETGVVRVEFRITSVLPSYLSSLIDIEGVEAFDLAFGLANNEKGVGILLACLDKVYGINRLVFYYLIVIK